MSSKMSINKGIKRKLDFGIQRNNKKTNNSFFNNHSNIKFIKKDLLDIPEITEDKNKIENELKDIKKKINTMEDEIEKIRDDTKKIIKNQRLFFDKFEDLLEYNEKILKLYKKINSSDTNIKEVDIEKEISKLNLSSCSYIS